jgi:hypothetical protein
MCKISVGLALLTISPVESSIARRDKRLNALNAVTDLKLIIIKLKVGFSFSDICI